MHEEILESEIGNLVWLESGGPPMTIVKIDNGVISTMWFDDNCTLHQADFVAEALSPEDPD